ncbi:T9SS type A sorting domain-containing protein [Hyunsoonleella sp. SJ7]|uniref:T9SS type A sorting domain-containing protein n=1 Tax=Hyunsoonleella aquatilis TaxID=2762758 RepID=A0A923HCL4_9FLAO|nr:T9SS type A sorting domain-containing protein [Hyunsoonleella aquatilis]MBC3758666.1 T9SS type A sorting domain-containing protein [Hyunsoonleella aquatilis]
MKKNTLKQILFYCFALFTLLINAQTAPDEDTGPIVECTPGGQGGQFVDIPNPENVGSIDDRSCYADYTKSSVNGKAWGVYNITHNSNRVDTNGLQPRIERSLSRSKETGVGSYARFTGTFRILEVGFTNNSNPFDDGSYIAQAKGKHTGEGGPPDPAICLYLAKPVYGTGADANKQVSFDIYAERILERGGSGGGREVVFLKNVDKNVETSFELEVGFRIEASFFGTKKVHYCDVVIGGETFKWNIPSPERGLESGIRYGAYRVKGGRAQIRWADTTYEKAEVIDDGSHENSDNYFRLINLATGKYLMTDGSTLVPSDSGEGESNEWRFVEVNTGAGNYYNIDSKVRGVIRFHGTSSAPLLTSTNFSPPNTAVDKIWTVHKNGDGTFSFEARFMGRFLYHYIDENNDIITYLPNLDAGSKWILESTVLSTDNIGLNTTSIKIYPNPAKDKFTINLQNINNVKQVQIYNILGKRVYQNTPSGNVLEVDSSRFQTGVYLVKAFLDNSKVFYSKLVIN